MLGYLSNAVIDYVFEGKHGIMNVFVECRFFFGFDKGKKHNDSKSKPPLRLSPT